MKTFVISLFILTCSTLVMAGCTTQPIQTPANHPASDQASEAPVDAAAPADPQAGHHH